MVVFADIEIVPDIKNREHRPREYRTHTVPEREPSYHGDDPHTIFSYICLERLEYECDIISIEHHEASDIIRDIPDPEDGEYLHHHRLDESARDPDDDSISAYLIKHPPHPTACHTECESP